VDIIFPDGETIGSDSPALSARLSDLMGRSVALHPIRPATDTTYYRRREPGAAIIGALARYRPAKRVLAWMAAHGLAGGNLREEFGRRRGEPLPDLTSVPAELFEFYTPPGTYFDVFPVHVLTTGALAMMARLNPGADWDVRRFRPNILVDTGPDAAEQIECRWTGQRVRIGRITVKGEMPTIRCAMPMHAQSGLPRDASILRTIVREADQCLGPLRLCRRGGQRPSRGIRRSRRLSALDSPSCSNRASALTRQSALIIIGSIPVCGSRSDRRQVVARAGL
jgi:hypothetical protein